MSRTMTFVIILALTAVLSPAAVASPWAGADPDDPHLELQWNLPMINAPEAWKSSTGSGTRVAVIDDGIDRDHPDLSGKIIDGITFRGCSDEPDGCGDGDYRDTIGPDEVPSQHGIASAGVAAAATGNGEGIAGVAPDAGILGIKSGNVSHAGDDIIASIYWAVDNGADVITMSLSGLLTLETLRRADVDRLDALAYARDNDVVVVASAGNTQTPLCNPLAYYAEVLCVVAVDQHEQRTWYTAFGRDEAGSAVAAPGGQYIGQGEVLCEENVPATISLHNEQGYCQDALSSGYGWYSGTSAAAPHVAGVAALLAAQCRTADEIIQVIEGTARNPLSGDRGAWDPIWGYGIVDAAAAVATPVEEVRTTARPGLAHDPCVDGETPQRRPRCLPTWDTTFDGDGFVGALPEGWSTELAMDNGTGSWFAHGGPIVDFLTGRSGVSTWARGLDAKDDRLISHRFTASEGTRLRFPHHYALEDGRDGAVLEISTDEGVSWQDVGADRFVEGGYDGEIVTADGARPAWTGMPDGAAPTHELREALGSVRSVVALGDFAGRQIRLRWRLLQDEQRPDSLPGYDWYIDRVQLLECS